MRPKMKTEKPANVKESRMIDSSSSTKSEKSILPDGVLYEILLRSSVKLVLSFSCVSSPWRNAILEPGFVRKHLLQSTKLDRQKILMRANFDFFVCYLDYQNGSPVFQVESTHSFLLNEKWLSQSVVIGSYNGLVVLGLKAEQCLALWNPSTRVCNYFGCSSYPPDINFTGVCYDSSSEDYKAVLGKTSKDDYMRLLIYSFRNNSSQTITDLPYFAEKGPKGVTVNGVLHWSIRKRDAFDFYTYGRVIAYYDSADHLVEDMMLPAECYKKCFDESINYSDVQLTSMKGCLCLFYYRPAYHKSELWMMKEYHVVESWIQVICSTDLLISSHYNFQPKPLFFTSNGKLVIATKKKRLAIYDPVKRSITTHRIKLLIVVKRPFIVEPVEAIFLDSLVVPEVGG